MNAQFKGAALGLDVDLKSLLSPHTLTRAPTLTGMAVALSTSVGWARLCSLRKVPVSAEGKAPGEVEALQNHAKAADSQAPPISEDGWERGENSHSPVKKLVKSYWETQALVYASAGEILPLATWLPRKWRGTHRGLFYGTRVPGIPRFKHLN